MSGTPPGVLPVPVTIPNLPAATTPLNGADELAVSQNGSTKFVTISSFFAGASYNAALASPPPIGSTAPNTGAFTTLTATGGTINGASIGATTASTGAFTTLSATSTVSGAGFTAWAASPPPIGATAPNAGAFTNLSASATLVATGTVSGSGFTLWAALPPPIGSSVPNTGKFTTLSMLPPFGDTADTITITATPGVAGSGAFAQVINAHVNAGGTLTIGGSQSCYGFIIDNDNMVMPAGGGTFSVLAADGNVITGASGDRVGVTGAVSISGTPIDNSIYVAGYFTASASVNANGTSGSPSGSLTALNPLAQLSAGATYWKGISAAEFDINVFTGASVAYKQGIFIVQGGATTVHGTLEDSAIVLANNSTGGTAVGWEIGLSFGSPQGWWAIDSTGTMIGTNTPLAGGPAYDAALGIDFSAVTFSTGFLKSVGFLVDGSGHTTAASVAIGTGGPTWTAGTGAPTSTQPNGSLYSRTDGTTGARLYVSAGAGTWAAVAGV